ncbi:MAG: type IX secretion system sortase PorU [Ignavibacteriales bacterium]
MATLLSMKSKYSIAILFFIIFSTPLLAGQDIKIITSNSSYLLLEYTPVYTDTSDVTIDNQVYKKIRVLEGAIFSPEKTGMPAIPVRRFSIGVPGEFGNTIQVVSSDYREIQGRIAPVATQRLNDGLLTDVYKLSENYNTYQAGDIASFGDYGLTRDLPMQVVNLSPVQYDVQRGVIRLYKRIVVRVNFAAAKSLAQNKISDGLLDGIVLNYDVAKNWISRNTRLKKTIANSVLAAGRWFRFEAPDEGIYKLTPAILTSIGINPATVDPKTIKIYNNGGKVLPETVSAPRPDDLVENATYLYKPQDDGKFNEGDYILFYGRGISFWDVDSLRGQVVRNYHTYSKSNYYWLTFGNGTAKRTRETASLQQAPDLVQNTTQAFASWQEDKYKLLSSGRYYLGDQFSEITPSRPYMTSLTGIVPGSRVRYKFSLVNKSEYTATFSIQENSTPIYSGYLTGVGVGQMEEPQNENFDNLVDSASYQSALPDDKSVLKFTYKPYPGSVSDGYLDYFEIYYTRQMQALSDQLMFFSADMNGVVEFKLNGFSTSDIKVFNVSNYADVSLVSGAAVNGGECTFRANTVRKNLSKYLAVSPNAYKSPSGFVEMGNSNLHGSASQGKFIIITHKNFLDEANRLKSYRESQSRFKMSTVVTDVSQIYNEFSCGMTDVSAIRNYIKYAYDNWSVKPEYVLLFGDGDYDYKNVEGKNQNFVIPYESAESFRYMDSYASDDFYTLVSGDDDIVDLAIGRITVTTPEEAANSVNKIIAYENQGQSETADPAQSRLWRNLITLVADDGYTSKEWEGNLHTPQSEKLSNEIIPASFDQNKIYLAEYPTVLTATGRRKPDVNKAIVNAINDGTLIMNWVGHGNPEVWAHEYVFDKAITIPQLVNNKYFFLTAATCDFGRFDMPGVQSSTELMLLKPDGGSIGTLTACRTVFSDQNAALNEAFYSRLFIKDSTGYIRPIGKSYYSMKMVRNGTNDLKYLLFGDPTLRLSVPSTPVAIDSINHSPLAKAVQLKALSKTKIDGSVRNADGSLNTGFNGDGVVTVFDSERLVPLKDLGDYPITVQGGLLFRGRVSITNGRFSTEFMVPKDISYENKNGKVVAYVSSNNADGVGFTKNIIVGGTDSSIVNDNKGPQINISFDGAPAGAAYLVNPNSVLDVKLSDETGLNTTGTGIGHKITAILNGNENSPIDLSNTFVGDMNAGGKTGVATYKFNGLEFGDYKIQVRAWDIFNNSSTAEENFTVVDGSDLVIRDVLNYPNPFSSSTTFTFQRNQYSKPVDIKIKVYTVAGRMIKEIENFNNSDAFVRIDWDGRDHDGNMLANGVYLYKIIVKSTDDQFKQEVLGKLAVVR